jgi:predicted membrane metal-binding protein
MSAGFASGILLMPLAPAAWRIAVTLLALCFPLLWGFRGRRLFSVFFIFAFGLAGFLYAYKASLRPRLAVETFVPAGPESWAALIGTVKTFPEIRKNGRKETLSLVLSSERLRFPQRGVRTESFRVNGEVQVFIYNGAALPKPGEKISVYGRLEKPKPVENPGGFDYGRYLAQSGVHAVFHAYGPKSVRILESGKKSRAAQLIFVMQRAIAGAMDSLFPEREAVLFKAMVLGSRKGMDPDLRSDFFKTGTSHVNPT